jgi:hypothetical protein
MVGVEYRWSRRDTSSIIKRMGRIDLTSHCQFITVLLLAHKSEADK